MYRNERKWGKINYEGVAILLSWPSLKTGCNFIAVWTDVDSIFKVSSISDLKPMA